MHLSHTMHNVSKRCCLCESTSIFWQSKCERMCRPKELSRLHITRFLSCDASDRLRYEATRNRRGSRHLTDIGTFAIKPLIVNNKFIVILSILVISRDL